ncbi:polysaccharide deacetylase family protein [Azospirillum sp.]|uniref:polysaccharide deacetylase family protein n=1 Tax=Azospirillum sp. TaxID=34012 RepID=UPI003D750A55
MKTALKRRAFLAGMAALPAFPAHARELSWVATHGHAGFLTAQLYPGASLTLHPEALTENIVALTIDDGPDTAHDPEIRRILRAYGVPATYFLVGRHAQRHARLVREIADDGHEIGNHTWSHRRLIHCTPEEQAIELRRTSALLETITGRPTRWFRPPFGSYDEHTLGIARAAGLETMLWTADSQDYRDHPPVVIEERVMRGLTPGAVVLMHSNHAGTVAALPRILERAKDERFRFVTLTEWKAQMERAAA